MANNDILRNHINACLDTLPDMEKAVIRMLYGLDDGRPRALWEIGSKYNMTRARMKEIETKALRLIRHPCRK